MMTFKVYLAGPITGCSWGGATDWRTYAKEQLAAYSDGKILGYSPLRGKDYANLTTSTSIKDEYSDNLLTSQRGITARDRYDVFSADALLINFEGAERVSIGTVLEIAWADARKIPIVLVMGENNVHDHSMIRETCPFRVPDLEEGISLMARILLP